MRALMVIILFIFSSSASATEEYNSYVQRIVGKPGYAQSEYDRMYISDPFGTAYLLATHTADKCDFNKPSSMLKQFLDDRNRPSDPEDWKRAVLVSRLPRIGYPKPGDKMGLCKRAETDLKTAEEFVARCYKPVKKVKFGMSTCF